MGTKYILNENKYKNAILYLARNLEKHSIFGRKKLYKLLYYLDFDSFERLGKPITGDIYHRINMGPAPRYADAIAEKLELDKALTITEERTGANLKDTVVYTALQEPDLSVFEKDELLILRRIVSKYGNKTGKQLEDLTHNEAPYLAVNFGEEIPLELAHYRGTDFTH